MSRYSRSYRTGPRFAQDDNDVSRVILSEAKDLCLSLAYEALIIFP